MKIFKAAALALLSLGVASLAACASAQTPAQAAQQVLDEYRLGTGDEIKITVFNEPNLSGPFVVDGTGVISMSLIGEVQVRNLTIRELESAIETKLKDGYLRNPQVSAEMTKGRPFYISGEVNRPGEYPFTSGITMMNAIVAAGDFTYRANRKTVLVKSADSQVEREVELKPTTVIKPGDMVRVRERFF